MSEQSTSEPAVTLFQTRDPRLVLRGRFPKRYCLAARPFVWAGAGAFLLLACLLLQLACLLLQLRCLPRRSAALQRSTLAAGRSAAPAPAPASQQPR
jgi:hypothetical protein